jgi:HPt (histidine-containing phosphotransfer) domain-containing protein
MKGDDEKCFAAGCNGYLPKPIDRKKLIETLTKYLTVADSASQDSSDLSAGGLPKVEVEIDWQLLTERIGGEELIDEVIPIFIKDNTERMKMLSQAVERNDANEIKFYSHSLRGATATIGAAKISELAKQLETAARDSDNSGYRPLFEELNVRFAHLINFLSKSNWKQTAQQASLRQHTERS